MSPPDHKKSAVPDKSKGAPSEKRSKFHLGRLLLTLLSIFLLIVSLAIFLHRQLLQAYAPAMLDSLAWSMEEFYGLKFEYEGTKVSGLNDFDITGIKLTDITQDSTFFTCTSIRIRSSVFAIMLRGMDPVQAVTAVEIENPVINLGREEGKWNTGTLFEPGEGEPYDFPGILTVTMRNGKFEWLGGELADGVGLRNCWIKNFESELKLTNNSSMGITLDGILGGINVTESGISITGEYNPETYEMKISTSAPELDLSLLSEWLQEYNFNHITGTSNTSATILIGQSAGEDGWSLAGIGELNNGTISYEDYSAFASDLAGPLHFSGKSLFTSGIDGRVGPADINISGRLGDFGDTSYNLRIDADKIDEWLAGIMYPPLIFMPLQFDLSGTVEINGKTENLRFRASDVHGVCNYDGTIFNVEDLDGWYESKKLTIASALLNFFGGNISAAGTADFNNLPPVYSATASGYGFDVEELQYLVAPQSTGGLMRGGTASFSVSLQNDETGHPVYYGIADAGGIYLDGYTQYGSLHVNLPFRGNTDSVAITGISASSAVLSAIGSGTYNFDSGFTGDIAIVSSHDGILLSDSPYIAGNFAFAGDLDYSASSGVGLDGEAVISHAYVNSMELPEIATRINLTGDSLTLSEISGVVGGGIVEGDLTFPVSAGSSLTSGNFKIAGINVGNFLDPPYNEIFATSLDINGNLVYTPDAASGGIFTLELLISDDNVMIGPNLLSTGEEPLSASLSIPVRDISSAGMTINGKINSKPTGAALYEGRILTEYSAEVVRRVTELLSGQTYDVSVLPEIPALDGAISIDLSVKNLIAGANGYIELLSDGISIRGWQLKAVTARLESLDGERWTTDLILDSGESGSLSISGEITRAASFRESIIDLNAAISNSGLNQAFQFLGLSEYGKFTGEISGSGSIGGTIGSPTVRGFQLNMSESEAFGISLDQGTLNFGFDSPNLTFESLDLTGKDGFRALGQGSIDLSSPSLTNANFVFRVDNFDLQDTSGFTGTESPVSGSLSAVIQLAHDGLGPKVIYRFDVTSFGINTSGNTFNIGDIHLSAMQRPDSNILEISNIEITNGDESVHAEGQFPFIHTEDVPFIIQFLNKEPINPPIEAMNRIMELAVNYRHNIRIWSDSGYSPDIPPGLFAQGLSWSGGFGPFELNIGGKLIEPTITGDLNINVTDIRLGDLVLANGLSGQLSGTEDSLIAERGNLYFHGPDWRVELEGELDMGFVQSSLKNILLPALGPQVQPVTTVNDEANGDSPTVETVIARPLLSLSLPENEPITFSGSGYSVKLARSSMGGPPGLFLTDKGFQIAGALELVSGNLDLSKLPELPKGGSDRTYPFVDFDFGVYIGGTFRVLNGNLFSFDFTDGNIILMGSDVNPYFLGGISAPSGWLDLFGNHFTLTEPVELRFTQLEPFNPIVKAGARTIIRNVRSPGFYGEELAVNARIDSRMNNIIDSVQLTSDPDLPQDQIIAALAYEDFLFRTVGGTLLGDSTGGTSGFDSIDFSTVAIPFAASFITKYLRREVGLSDFQLSYDNDNHVRIYIESEVFDNVQMYFYQTFGPDISNDYLWGTRYRFRPRSYFVVELDSNEDVTTKVEYIIRY